VGAFTVAYTQGGCAGHPADSAATVGRYLRFSFCLLQKDNNSSGDEIANVNFLRRYGTYVLQNTKKENLLRLTN